ncbi:MAG: hypothetical protein EBY32_15830 [Proteobacteria bacterium]|nr:hypothetical protein [Pseudomonadota bacterium]
MYLDTKNHLGFQGIFIVIVYVWFRSLVATSVAAALAVTATAGLSVSLRLALIRIVLACVLVVLLIHMNDFMREIHVRMLREFPAGEGGDGARVHDATRMGHLSFTKKDFTPLA